MKRYTLAMKRKLVAEYATGDFPRKEFLSRHQIPNSTFHQWIHAYAEELLPALDAGMTVSGFRRLNLKIAVDGSTNYACDSNAEARMDLIAAKC